MPTGVYPRTEKHWANIEKARLIELELRKTRSPRKMPKLSQETKDKIGKAHKGKGPGKGKGRPCSSETKEKISKSEKGKIVSIETREKMRLNNLGSKSRFWKGGLSQIPGYINWLKNRRRIRKQQA